MISCNYNIAHVTAFMRKRWCSSRKRTIKQFSLNFLHLPPIFFHGPLKVVMSFGFIFNMRTPVTDSSTDYLHTTDTCHWQPSWLPPYNRHLSLTAHLTTSKQRTPVTDSPTAYLHTMDTFHWQPNWLPPYNKHLSLTAQLTTSIQKSPPRESNDPHPVKKSPFSEFFTLISNS